ncbi:rho GTPase-activating protein 11A isoform X2 [Parambassis ranga]|uniref:Rho GTPase-activating protein 11A isoform X2 n=1 Tax=Parambassis ranga TaxID=210632 RepID=A0A6P7H7G5_9TELE|nr:rho GTPase-activating protein 11A isoform X2 [Parambassis ranga]
MKVMERNVMRLLAVQQLRAAYGIKTKNWNKNRAASCKPAASNSTKVFGVPLERLSYYSMECGNVPRFLVDACMMLLAHVDTEGLFRKSGSVVRLKALRAKLDEGEECLRSALPCDVAGLVKQFFRELPEPVLPTELQEAFLKAQQLPTEEERTSATMLLSCVLPDRNQCVLRHFLDFLYNVSRRSAENKMDSSNLSVILAPNLLHSGDGTEKMNANTEKRLKLQAAIIHCFIENACKFGVLPQFLQEKVPAMMGCEEGVFSPNHEDAEELALNSGMKKKHRRSFGVFSSATPVIATPASKRKLPSESGHSFGFSNKKRRSVKKNLGIELLPNALFSGTSTPGSAYSASGVLDASQNMSSAGKSRRQSATSSRRKSRRLSNRHAVNRVESGRSGCFSPKVCKKEASRKSLRLRFSLGKSSKDAGSESIGWRLATQESTTSFRFSKETEFSPSVVPRKTESKGSKYISKSEDNLLTPQHDSSVHQISWSGETPVGAQAFSRGLFTDTPMNMCLKNNFSSEPVIVASKPPAGTSLPMKLCCASSAESLDSKPSTTEPQTQTAPTLLKIKKASAESGSDLHIQDCASPGTNITKPMADGTPIPPPETPKGKVLSLDTLETCSFPTQQSFLANEQNVTFGQIEIAALSPLHIDSVIFDTGVYCSPVIKNVKGSPSAAINSSHNNTLLEQSEREAEQVNCSRLIDALDIQSPAHFKLGVSSGLQSTPYKPGFGLRAEIVTPPATAPATGTVVGMLHEKEFFPESGTNVQNQQQPHSLETECRVADHIQYFNKLTLYSPRGSKCKATNSPLQFQRTPVRQTVRRINSLLGESRRPTRNADPTTNQSGQVAKAVSLESGLSPHPQLQPHLGETQMVLSNSMCPIKKPPPVPPKKPSTLGRKPKACALGDVTNKTQPKMKVDSAPGLSGAQKPLVQQVADKNMNYYRGSPRNPLNQGRLLSATKPVDL